MSYGKIDLQSIQATCQVATFHHYGNHGLYHLRQSLPYTPCVILKSPFVTFERTLTVSLIEILLTPFFQRPMAMEKQWFQKSHSSASSLWVSSVWISAVWRGCSYCSNAVQLHIMLCVNTFHVGLYGIIAAVPSERNDSGHWLLTHGLASLDFQVSSSSLADTGYKKAFNIVS